MALLDRLLSGFLSPLVSMFADKRNIDTFLIFIGLILESIAIALFAIAFICASKIYIMIFLATVFLGVGQSFYHPLAGSILSYVYRKKSPTALGINGVVGSIGRSLMPGLITALIIHFGEIKGMLLTSVYIVITSIGVYFGLLGFNRSNYDTNNNCNPETKYKKLKFETRYTKFLMILGAIIFIRSMFTWGILTFIGDYIYIVYKSKALVGVFLSVSFIGAIIGQAFFGWLTTKKGGRYTVFFTTIGSFASFFAFLIWHNYLFSVVMYFLETFFAMVSFPVLVGYITQVFPQKYTATASSYIEGLYNMVGGAVGTGIITIILGFGINIYTAFWFMLFFGFISTIMLPLIPKKL
jgi:MFS family permease